MGKRMAALALAVCMALPLFGCGGKLKAQSLTEGITARTIDTHVKKLRSKLGDKGEYIRTIWGMGYKYEVGE